MVTSPATSAVSRKGGLCVDMNLLFDFFLFVLVGHSAYGRNRPTSKPRRALDLKGSLSGRTPLERVLMSLSGSLTASGGENGN